MAPYRAGARLARRACVVCQQRFQVGDRIREAVTGGADRGRGLELQIATVHADCRDPQGRRRR